MIFDKKRKIDREEALRREFLPETDELIEKPVSIVGRFHIYIIALFIIITILWSIIGTLDEVAIARGKIIPIEKIQVVQAEKGGEVTEILVHEGDTVQKDQILVKLDALQYQILAEKTGDELKNAEYQKNLFVTFIENQDIKKYFETIDGKDDVEKSVILLLTSMQENYILRKDALLLDKKNFDGLILQKKQLIEQKRDEIQVSEKKKEVESDASASSGEQIALDQTMIKLEFLDKERKTLKKLYEAGAVTKEEYEKANLEYEIYAAENDLQEVILDNANDEKTLEGITNVKTVSILKSELEVLQLDLEKAQNDLKKCEKEMLQLEQETKENILNLVVSNGIEIEGLKKQLEIETLDYEKQVLASPVEGIVQQMGVTTLGEVVASTQTVATIVPIDSTTVVEAYLPNKDIGFVKVGQKVNVKMDTFNFQKYGSINGTVVEISPDAIIDEKMGQVYRIKVQLEDHSIKVDGVEQQLSSGMECSVEVIIGKRRIIEFFMEPLFEHLDSGLKVR